MGRKDRAALFQTPDDDTLIAVRKILRGSRFGALAVNEPESGHPFASRVLVGTDLDGIPVLLCSQLAKHTQAMLNDPRCSLLLGEPGKGDPLAWPRLTVQAKATRIEKETETHHAIRARFLRRHPKALLYVDFGDFSFFKLVPIEAFFNGGFSKAYNISPSVLIIHSSINKLVINN